MTLWSSRLHRYRLVDFILNGLEALLSQDDASTRRAEYLRKKTLGELRALAKKRTLKRYSRLKKDALVELLLASE